MAQFDIRWHNVNQDINPEFTKPKSYADSIGVLGKALNTYADGQRDANTNAVLQQILQTNTRQGVNDVQASALQGIEQLGGAINGVGILEMLNQQRKQVNANVSAEDSRIGQGLVSQSILNKDSVDQFNLNAQEYLKQNPNVSPEILGALAGQQGALTANAAATAQQQFKNNLDSIEAANSVEKVRQDGLKINSDIVKNAVTMPDKEVTTYEYDPVTRQQVAVTKTVPGYLATGGVLGLGSTTANNGGGVKPVKVEQHHNTVASSAKSFGWSDEVTAGVLGNFEIEGGYKGGRGDGGNSHGIAQWFSKDRKQNFQSVIGKPVSDASVEEQMRFVKWEFDNPTKAFVTKDGLSPVQQRDAILNAKSPQEAAELIDKYYERSSGEHRNKRVAHANNFYSSITGQSGSTNSGALNTTTVTATGKPATTATAKAKGFTLTEATGKRLPTIMQGYKDSVALEKKMQLASLDQGAIRQDFDNFLKTNGAIGASGILKNANTQTYEAIESMKAKMPQYAKLPAEDKKKVLTYMFNDAKTKGFSRVNFNNEFPKAVQQVIAVRTQAEKARELKFVKAEAEKVLAENKSLNPNMTLNDAIKMVSVNAHNQINKGVSKASTVTIPKTIAKPVKSPLNPTAQAYLNVHGYKHSGESDNPFE